MEKLFFCSWSGGKDSSFALFKAVNMGMQPHCLFTMMTENPERSRSHGLHIKLLQAQSKAIRLPLVTVSAKWEDYESAFIKQLKVFKKNGVTDGVFGDIDIEAHREWVEHASQAAEIIPHEPLWQKDRERLVVDFINSGFKAAIVSVKSDVLDPGFLGCDLTLDLLEKFRELNIDLAGENGEYHTFVYDGPLFAERIAFARGDNVHRNGYSFCDLILEGGI